MIIFFIIRQRSYHIIIPWLSLSALKRHQIILCQHQIRKAPTDLLNVWVARYTESSRNLLHCILWKSIFCDLYFALHFFHETKHIAYSICALECATSYLIASANTSFPCSILHRGHTYTSAITLPPSIHLHHQTIFEIIKERYSNRWTR